MGGRRERERSGEVRRWSCCCSPVARRPSARGGLGCVEASGIEGALPPHGREGARGSSEWARGSSPLVVPTARVAEKYVRWIWQVAQSPSCFDLPCCLMVDSSTGIHTHGSSPGDHPPEVPSPYHSIEVCDRRLC